MATINEVKQQEITETPLLLFECELPNSTGVERWSTHQATLDGIEYDGRVLRHNLFDIRSTTEQGAEALARLSLTLSNVDSHLSQIERSIGLKGAKLTVRFVFATLAGGTLTTDSAVLFRGICNPAEEITETSIRLSFTNPLNLQRALLPEVRIQRRCPWVFPTTEDQRREAKDGGSRGKYSMYFRCGYSPDVDGGSGNLNGDQPFTTCDYTPTQCHQRGMFSSDVMLRPTRRFGGIEFVPSSILVKTYGEKSTHVSSPVDNEAKYNDFIPLVYGTAWYRPPVIFARNDGNLTRMEVLLGMGEMSGVVKVVVNGIEMPQGRAGANMTATGWYNVINPGNRTGTFNPDFTLSDGSPAGDPYGSMATLSVVVPNRVSDGKNLPKIDVLVNGMQLDTFDLDGTYMGQRFTNNPAWCLLDVLLRSGWALADVNLPSFARAAGVCDELIDTTDPYGAPLSIARFQFNFAVTKRRSAADLIRGIRMGSAMLLRYDGNGLLELVAEASCATQHPTQSPGSNALQVLNGGWPVYEFGDGTLSRGDILRRSDGSPALRVWSRSIADCPNRLSVEFQDAFNEFQQDSMSMVDLPDLERTGHEVSASLTALGLSNLNQAARILRLQLDKSVRGNVYVEFESGLRALGVRPGDLITLTYLKEGFERTAFRVLSISPTINHETCTIVAQIHDDSWYVGNAGDSGVSGRGRHTRFEVGVPRPLASGYSVEEISTDSSGVRLAVSFKPPVKPSISAGSIPIVGLNVEILPGAGTLAEGGVYYYAIAAVDSDGVESALSFTVPADIPNGVENAAVRLRISTGTNTAAMRIYRGASPSQLVRITETAPVSEFTDTGLVDTDISPADGNFDHANFYWRLELQPEAPATGWSASSIGSTQLQMIDNEWRGRTVRITQGTGAGQERPILSNDQHTMILGQAWSIQPDGTSRFVVTESSWNFGALTATSPVEFTVPNRAHATLQISGRAANVHDVECAYELSPLYRHQLTAGGSGGDTGVPPAPQFALHSSGLGTFEVSSVGFETLVNTSTVRAGELDVYYIDELAGGPGLVSLGPVGTSDAILDVPPGAEWAPGDILAIDRELLRVADVPPDGSTAVIQRATYGSPAGPHAPDTPILAVSKRSYVLPFASAFFGSAASGSYAFPVVMPNVRIVAAVLCMTNVAGKGAASAAAYTMTQDYGIRTLSGGQITLQVAGYLAIQNQAVPAVVVDRSRSVRDVVASVGEAPTQFPIDIRVTADGDEWCRLTIPVGVFESSALDGRSLLPLRSETKLNLDIISVGQTFESSPGRDLTVSVRF